MKEIQRTRADWSGYIENGSTPCRLEPTEFEDYFVVTVDIAELYMYDEMLTQALFDSPCREILKLRKTSRSLFNHDAPIQVRLKNNPQQYDISQISAQHIHELVTIRGSATELRSRQSTIHRAKLECDSCSRVTSAPQIGFQLETPTTCTSSDCSGEYSLQAETTEYIDIQPALMTDLQPASDAQLTACLIGEAISTFDTDESFSVTGILLPIRDNANSTMCEMKLWVLNITNQNTGGDDRDISDSIDSIWNQ